MLEQVHAKAYTEAVEAAKRKAEAAKEEAWNQTIASGAGEIGSILGSQIGSALAGRNVFARVAASTVLSATLKTIGEGLGGYFTDTTGRLSVIGEFNDAASGFGNNLVSAFQGQAIGAISGFLTGELAESLGLKGFGGGLFKTVTSSVTSTVLNNAVKLATLSSAEIAPAANPLPAAFGKLRAANDNAPASANFARAA